MPAERLFSYGTLQQPDVQLATFGRPLAGRRDALPRYEVAECVVQDPAFVAASGKANHAIARFTGRDADSISGTVLEVTRAELQLADSYEPDGYFRTAVILQSGTRAWVYAAAREAHPRGS